VPASGPRISQITPIGSVKRGGHWRIDRDMEIGTVVGSVKLDLRHAEIAAAVVDMHVRATLGSVKIWIPRGIAVEVDGTSVLGSRTIAESAAVPGAPLLRLHIDTVIGSVKVYRR
jgi:predicted membrane protein